MQLAKELADMKDVTSLTFEGNIIQDEQAVCALFQNLKSFDKLENLNIRQNRFSPKITDALCEGILHKKELRVSFHATLTPH